MKIILVHPVSLNTAEEDGSTFVTLLKNFESDIKPCEGDLIEDPAFAEYPFGYEVVKVTIDFAENACYVSIGVLELDSGDGVILTGYVDHALAHGWRLEKAERDQAK